MSRTVSFKAEVKDDQGNVSVLMASALINEGPIIDRITVEPPEVRPGGSATITIFATDPENRPLTYALTAAEGTVVQGAQPHIFIWTAPA